MTYGTCCDRLYYCPTAGEDECDVHGGFDVCCNRPDLHRPPVIGAAPAYAAAYGVGGDRDADEGPVEPARPRPRTLPAAPTPRRARPKRG